MLKSLGAKTLAFPAPAWAVGTYDENGKPNAMLAAWAGLCCSKPPCVSVSLRSATYSHHAVIAQKAFTVNIPSEEFVKEADYLGMASGRDEDKFAKAGLSTIPSELVYAPIITDFPMVLECKLVHTVEVGLHTLFVGEIQDVKVQEELLDLNGHLDTDKLKPVVFGPGSRHYYGIGKFLGKAFSIGDEIRKK
ncbi:flavin reductase family protein [Desulfobaculum bizertense]|uniref:NADH-FMN oxidoreductase RutF, flavin reductase (DIM6/NTAB) family n=1 Tax=Desulfobaculum bizertense DSM 18034 TaxID=1121442 RepID=A0A1T4VEY9_9BACT|nr:flavin reductase family protein [Desulfobaculum bizertense]UIJ37684.1 flavin reductase family protein [Desulfobaculum bizertense]SKA63487.1 NADH-FMN oxidoreductase RutF, flavin reductase (DIM6/NTAB) family [Desulfobaculum bizertense DSM 18034]